MGNLTEQDLGTLSERYRYTKKINDDFILCNSLIHSTQEKIKQKRE
jgi:hypothetical protein